MWCAGQPSDVACQELIDQHSLLLLPAEVWEHEPSQQQQRLRIGFGRTSLPAALEHLGQYLLQKRAVGRKFLSQESDIEQDD